MCFALNRLALNRLALNRLALSDDSVHQATLVTQSLAGVTELAQSEYEGA